MSSAFASLVAGFLFYLVLLWRQRPAQRLSIDTWRDYLGISFVSSLALLGLVLWVAVGLGPGASDASIIERLFAPIRWRYRWMPYVGFGAAAFAICAALHMMFLKIARRNSDGVDA